MTGTGNRLAFVRIWGIALLIAGWTTTAGAQTFFINTGPGGTSSVGATSLFASGSTGCTPQPQCSQAFQYLAARLIVTEAVTLRDIGLWVAPFSFGGSIDVKIREEIIGPNLPATTAPPLFSANSIYSKRYTNLPNVFGAAQWVDFPNYETVLAAGTYWLTFEPVPGSGLQYSVPPNVATPVSKYAFYGNDNPGYLTLNRTFGVRVAGEFFPGVAFGTATRVVASSTFFDCCNHFDDHIAEGTRDFAWGGQNGPALTSSYIFHFGVSHIHGRGRLIENGLSAGAYSETGTGNGAGRGIAYRTLINLSGQDRTFRVNATLHGAFFNGGGLARAGIYVLDTGLFSSTLAASPKTPGHFMLDTDGLDRLANVNDTIRPVRFFPTATLLAFDEETPVFPAGEARSVPMQTGFVTLPANGAITILFDVSAHSSQHGDVNFANTLSPAPVFLTDVAGNPVFDVVAVGPSAPPAPPAATVSLTPASATTTVGGTRSLTATVLSATGAPIADQNLTFVVTSGPNAGAPVTVTTDGNGEAVFSYIGVTPGVDTVQASAGTLISNSVSHTWVAGPADRVVISPVAAVIAAGASQAFTVAAFDAFNNSLGDVTGSSTLTIAPDGSCTGATCTASTAGVRTVTAAFAGRTDTASLTFTAVTAGFTFSGFFAPIDNLPVVNSMKAGSSVPVKFSLGGNHGLSIFAPGFPVSQLMACQGAVEAAVEQTVTAGGSSLQYDAATDQYTYVWKTDKAWDKTCRQLTIKLSDGSVHTAAFKFK